ncbi:hypothetical protein AAFP30_16255 [Gordonia sp. CPCC 205515]|uniref:hypothetical protein n=1 Tax=Gordonia sp. CPCC 205515 TaxID=3140791 RepID=UPI003AF3A223
MVRTCLARRFGMPVCVRRAEFGRAALAAVQSRTWPSVYEQLVGHYWAVIEGEQVVSLAG